MDGWHLALYALAFYAALRTLLTLMQAHEQKLRRELAQSARVASEAANRAASPAHRG